jgi:hypothetical protein
LKNSIASFKEALQKPGFFKEFLGGQVFRGRKPIKRYTCSQANLSNNKITKKDSFLKSFLKMGIGIKPTFAFYFLSFIDKNSTFYLATMALFDLLEIQRKLEEQRLILGQKLEIFLLTKIFLFMNFCKRVFAGRKCAFFGCFFIILISLLIRSTRDIGYDSAFFLEIATKLLNGQKYGQKYYGDFFINNPPLVFYFIMFSQLAAKFFAINPIIAQEILNNLTGILALYFCNKILARSFIFKDKIAFNLIILTFACAFFLRFFTLQYNEFGTRSTYFLALAFPYISYHFLGDFELKKIDQILTGILAALLFCLKLHYGILVIVFELQKFYEKKSPKSFLCLRNGITSGLLILYLAFIYWPQDAPQNHLNNFNYYLNYFQIFKIVRENLFLLFVLVFLCFHLIKKSSLLQRFFFTALAGALIIIPESAANYDQKSVFYSLSLPLVVLLALEIVKNHRINYLQNYPQNYRENYLQNYRENYLQNYRENYLQNYRENYLQNYLQNYWENYRGNWLILLLILTISQFDPPSFINIALNCCEFWWLFALFLSAKWRKTLAQHNLLPKLPNLRNFNFGNFPAIFFMQNSLLSCFCFLLLAALSIFLACNKATGNLSWILSAIIFVFLVGFYQKLYEKTFVTKSFSGFSSGVIFTILSCFITLQTEAICGAAISGAAIFNADDYKSPNYVNDQMAKIIKQHLKKEDDLTIISAAAFGTYPLIIYLHKENHLESSQLLSLYNRIDNAIDDGTDNVIDAEKQMSQTDKYLFLGLKSQIKNPKNKLIFVEIKSDVFDDQCHIGFLENHFSDTEFKEFFLQNYVFLNRITAFSFPENNGQNKQNNSEENDKKKITFFNQDPKSADLKENSNLIARDIEVYIRNKL